VTGKDAELQLMCEPGASKMCSGSALGPASALNDLEWNRCGREL